MTDEMKGMIMIASTMPEVSMPMPSGAPENSAPMQRDRAQPVDQHRLDVIRHERREGEKTPHAVNDRGNAGEKLDGTADRSADGSAGPLR